MTIEIDNYFTLPFQQDEKSEGSFPHPHTKCLQPGLGPFDYFDCFENFLLAKNIQQVECLIFLKFDLICCFSFLFAIFVIHQKNKNEKKNMGKVCI